MQWKSTVGETRSRGKLSAGLGARGLENRIMKIYAAKKSQAKNLMKETADAMSLGTEWMNETPREVELALLRESQDLQVPGRTVREAIKAG